MARIPALSLTLALATSVTAEVAPTQLSEKTLHPFLEEHCIRCHGEKKQKGQVRFDEAVFQIATNSEAQRWQDVLDILNGGDMPPEDEPQPSREELTAILDHLTGKLRTARRRLTDHGGATVLRRLNRREYANSIQSLLGLSVLEDRIPDNGEISSFDTVGAEQFFSSQHFDDYLSLSTEILEVALGRATQRRKESVVSRKETEGNRYEKYSQRVAEYEDKWAMKEAGRTWQEMGFEDEGQAKILFSQFNSRHGKPKAYLEYPRAREGIYLTGQPDASRTGIAFGIDPRATYRLRIHGGIVGDVPELRKFLILSDRNRVLGAHRLRGTVEKPQTIEIDLPQPTLHSPQMHLTIQENRADIRVLDSYRKRIDPQKLEGEWASLWIDWVEVEGPFYPAERSVLEQILVPISPDDSEQTRRDLSDDEVRRALQEFAKAAFRGRPAAPEYLDALVAIFEENRAAGMGFHKALTEPLAIILSSPGFLYLQEPSEAGLLSGQGLAVRLSYFLWSAPPDEELLRAAAAGELADPAGRRAQVERLLADPRAAQLAEGFGSQWADLERFDAITVDEQQYFLFNRGIRHAAERETIEFLRTLIADDLPVANLIDSDFVTINTVLAEHYGLPEIEAGGFQKIDLPSDSPRGGLLGQTTFLTMGSTGERTSPVIRGALVMEKLLHDKPAPPPPNVPELGTADGKPRTNRQLVELHQTKAQCASCHEKMDVIGFGLENFDAVGRWRETEPLGRKEVPVDPSGVLSDRGEFADLDGLKALLSEDSEPLARSLIEDLLTYAIGRTIEFSDADEIDRLVAALRPSEFRLRAMIHEITESPLFLRR